MNEGWYRSHRDWTLAAAFDCTTNRDSRAASPTLNLRCRLYRLINESIGKYSLRGFPSRQTSRCEYNERCPEVRSAGSQRAEFSSSHPCRSPRTSACPFLRVGPGPARRYRSNLNPRLCSVKRLHVGCTVMCCIHCVCNNMRGVLWTFAST